MFFGSRRVIFGNYLIYGSVSYLVSHILCESANPVELYFSDMSSSEEVVQREHQFLLQTYNRYPLVIARGKGVFLFDPRRQTLLGFRCRPGCECVGPRTPENRENHPRTVCAGHSLIESLLQRIPGTACREALPALRYAAGVFL